MDIDFDVMTNQQLQKRLVEYGIPSVPVTQTTRKILIKKLKLASEKEKQKTRRETIAITKFSSDEEKESESDRKKREKTPNRRATIAPGEKASKSATSSTNGAGKDVTEMPAPRSTRRSISGRITPLSEKPTLLTSTVPVVPAILEDTDEEVKETLKTAPKRFSKSKSKTPTLSKTDTVRISYKAEQEKAIREEEDDVMIVDDDDDDEPEIIAPVSKIPEPKFVSKTETVSRRKTITTSGTPNTMTSSIPTFSTRYSSVGDSKYERPSLGTSYRSYTSTSTSYRPAEKYQDEDEDDEEENIDANAPYLSNFAKRLSTLRAEPLDAGLDQYKKKLRENVEYPSYRPSSSGYSYKREVIAPAKDKQTLTSSFINVLEALDRQYHIRKTLYFLFVIIILVAFYVIFIKN